MSSTAYGRTTPRPNASHLKCSLCGRVFAAGFVPTPEPSGEFEGALICRDCRADLPLQYQIAHFAA